VWLGVLPEFASEAIDLNFESPAIPLRRLTTQGGNYATWQNDSTLAWVFTNRVFRQHVNAEEPDEITRIALTVERPRPNGRIAFTNTRLITMEGERVIEDGTIVVDGNRIVAIGRSGEVAVPGDAEVVDARGKTIMPGIVDVHAHMHYAAFETFPEQKWEYIANLAYGVTSTYDPSSHNLDVFAQQEMVEADEMIGPRIFSSGDVIYGTESVFPVVYEDISSIDDARDIVARFTAYSPEMIKEYMQPRRDSRQWLAQAAREHRVMITAEGGGDLVLDMTLVLDGYSAFEHALPIAPLYKDVVELVAESRVHYTPTLIVGYGGATLEQVMVTRENIHENQKLRRFTPEPELDRWRRWQFVPEEEWHFLHIAQSAAKMTKRGGYVTLGAHGNRQGLGAQWELWGLHMGGLTNMEALRSATSLAAEKIGYAEDLGRLGTGMLADFLVLNSNPLEDIRSTADIQYVIKNGVVWDAESMMQIYPERKPLERFFWQTEEEYRRYMATDPTEQGR
jgi:imidazolonepropionase-like amidohydrolase